MRDNELGLFLKSRRARVDPVTAGVRTSTRRRVAGLRREELALLAGVSVSYYTRLEQGTDRNPSVEVLEALARVLRLDAAERRYLLELGGPAPGPATTEEPGAPDGQVRPGILHLLTRWADLPAFVVTPRRDVLAATDLATRVNPAWAAGANLVEFTFLDPRARATYPEWDLIAAQAVAGLRASSPQHPEMVAPFVRALARRSAEFRALWEGRDVVDRSVGAKALRLTDERTLRLHYETFAVTGADGLVLYVYFPARGSPDAELLHELYREHG